MCNTFVHPDCLTIAWSQRTLGKTLHVSLKGALDERWKRERGATQMRVRMPYNLGLNVGAPSAVDVRAGAGLSLPDSNV